MPAVGADQATLADADAFRAAAREGAHDRGAAADVGAVADDDALRRCGPRPSSVPRVPALKLQKPSCMTVVPAARWAPRRTRSASAMRTPCGHDVVGHPRELVDAVAPATVLPRARSRSRVARSRRRRRGRALVQTTLVSGAEDAVEVDRVGRDEAVREQVQAQVGVGCVGRRGVEVDLDEAHLGADAARLVRAAERLQPVRGGRRRRAARRAPAAGNHVSSTCPSSVIVASP